MAKQIMIPVGDKSVRVILTEADAEKYIKGQRCNRSWLRRQFRSTTAEPTHALMGANTLVSVR